MFEIFMEEKMVTSFMLVFVGMSIFLRVLLGLLYQNMIKETDNMSVTKNKLLKQCKLKFENCYQLNNGVSNIPIFVDKFLNRLTFGPLSFEVMYHLSGQCMLFSVICAGVGIYRCIMDGRMLGEILPFYIVSFFGLYMYFSVSTVVDIKGKRRVLKVNLVDYLENHLSSRIHVTAADLELLYGQSSVPSSKNSRTGERGKSTKRTVEWMPIEGRNRERQPARQLAMVSGGMGGNVSAQVAPTEEELEALLKEFLVN